MSTALIAEDEPLLREALVRQLAQAWPALRVVALARNGHEALSLFDQHQPAICFLDVHMPGLSGLQVAQTIGRRAHLVFVTAYDQYAVGAFAAAAVDYLLKPVRADRLAETVLRLQERLRNAAPASGTETLLQQLIDRMTAPAPTVRAPLRWLQAQSGPTLRLIAVEDVDYLQADLKYTRVAWRDPGGQPLQALIRTPLKTLLEQLDGSQFKQVHRSTVVNLRAILHIHRPDPETAVIHLRNRPETLRISRSHLDQFRQM